MIQAYGLFEIIQKYRKNHNLLQWQILQGTYNCFGLFNAITFSYSYYVCVVEKAKSCFVYSDFIFKNGKKYLIEVERNCRRGKRSKWSILSLKSVKSI